MSYDRQQFLDTIKQRTAERQGEMMPLLRVVQAAGQVMETLTTNSEPWNRYLSYLQGQIDKAEATRRAAQDKLSDPTIWDAQTMAQIKSGMLEAGAMIRAWQLAMELPKLIMENSDRVQDVINKFDQSHEPTGQTES